MKEGAKARPADELLRLMRVGSKEIYEVKCGEATVYFRILTEDEKAKIRKNAIVSSKGDEFERDREIRRSTLRLASTVEKGSMPQLHDEALQSMTADEIHYWYSHYIRIEDEVNPNYRTMEPEQFQMLVDHLKKNLITVKDLSIPQLREISEAFVDLIVRLDTLKEQQDSSPGGSS